MTTEIAGTAIALLNGHLTRAYRASLKKKDEKGEEAA